MRQSGREDHTFAHEQLSVNAFVEPAFTYHTLSFEISGEIYVCVGVGTLQIDIEDVLEHLLCRNGFGQPDIV